MQILEKTKEEVMFKAEKMSDFLKMEYLEKCAGIFRDPEILKHCYSQLVNLYEDRLMYSDSLKYLSKLLELTNNYTDKFRLLQKEIEILIKSGNYDRVENTYKNAAKFATSDLEIYNLKRLVINLYKSEAYKFERQNRNYGLLRIYEKIIPILTDTDRNEYKKKLFEVYKKLGKVRESLALEKTIHF